jgi:hypothetical protein
VTGKVRYEASLIQYRFQRGDRIRLYARFVNATKQPVTIWSCGFWSNHEITLRDEHGVEPPLTQLGESCRKLFAPAGERNKNVPNVVKPGEEYRETSEIDLSRLYELDKGLYRFRVIYHDLQGPTPLRVVSNPVEFVIE